MAKNNENMLAPNFITELLAVALKRRTVFDVARQYLKFSFLQTEQEKKIWQWCTKRYDLTGQIPTIGQLQQQFIDDDKTLERVADISDVEIDDDYNYDGLIDTFERFIKKMTFLEANDKITAAYN